MRNKIFFKRIIPIIIIALYYQIASATILSLPQIDQIETQWCWAAVSQSILEYYGYNNSQQEIAQYGTDGVNTYNWLWGSTTDPTRNGINYILDHFGDISTCKIEHHLTQTQTNDLITSYRPFVIRWEWNTGVGHFVVAKGLEDNTIHIMDPWYGYTINNYSWVVGGSFHQWTHTLMLCDHSNMINSVRPSAGNGTNNDPYQISSLQNLRWIAAEENRWNKHYIQVADLDASATSKCELWNEAGWLPIGNCTTSFSGSYDGQGFIIEGLYIVRPHTDYRGLFGDTNLATISNVAVINAQIEGNDYVGGLVGYHKASSIVNSFCSGNIIGNDKVGGLVGKNVYYSSTINSSYSIGNVSGYENVGGFIGKATLASRTKNSYSRMNVMRRGDTETSLGGFCGYNDQSIITNSYSTGYVKTETGENIEVKGFVGEVITGGYYAMNNNYFDMDTSEQTTSLGAEGRTTEEMTYPYAENTYVGWDFDDIWAMDENYEINDGYPYLQGIDYVFAEDEPFIISPSEITLFNYPNPFNPETTIDFSLSQSGLVTIEIFNIRGQKVQTLINSEYAAGLHSVFWDGRDEQDREVSGGVYLYQLSSGEHKETRKMLLLK